MNIWNEVKAGRLGQATPVTAQEFANTPIANALRSGRSMGGGMKDIQPGGMLGAIGGASIAGYYSGDQNASSFLKGGLGGMLGGAISLSAAESGAQYFSQHSGAARRAAGTATTEAMSRSSSHAMSVGRMMTSAHNRGMLFGAGALLGGSLFSSMFSSNSTNYASGLNSTRGNRISR